MIISTDVEIMHLQRIGSSLAEEDWHMPIEIFQYFIILFRVNQVFTFNHFIEVNRLITILANYSDFNCEVLVVLRAR